MSETVIKQVFISCAQIQIDFYFLYRDLSVDKNSLAVSPADKILAEDIQTIDGQRLAGQHVSRLQAALAGVSTEPGTDKRLVSSSWGHGTVGYHAVVSTSWKANNCILLYCIWRHICGLFTT